MCTAYGGARNIDVPLLSETIPREFYGSVFLGGSRCEARCSHAELYRCCSPSHWQLEAESHHVLIANLGDGPWTDDCPAGLWAIAAMLTKRPQFTVQCALAFAQRYFVTAALLEDGANGVYTRVW